MKSLIQYINEGLKTEYRKWFKQVYQTQQTLIKDNQVEAIQININKLNKPKKTFTFEDFSTDDIVKKIVSDKQVGFAITNQMIYNPKQYIQDPEKEIKPECLPYWYKNGDNVYFAGICMFDQNVSYIDNFIHLIEIESSLIVKNPVPLNKAILMDFIKYIKSKNQQIIGITAKPTHPKMKAILIKLGFDSFKDNKEILTYKI